MKKRWLCHQLLVGSIPPLSFDSSSKKAEKRAQLKKEKIEKRSAENRYKSLFRHYGIRSFRDGTVFTYKD